jgi:hypothetical protein
MDNAMCLVQEVLMADLPSACLTFDATTGFEYSLNNGAWSRPVNFSCSYKYIRR